MSKLVIVVHYHEIWLKGGNRRFFLSKLHMALKRALEGLPVERILRPGDRLLIEFGEGASAEEAIARIERVFGVAFYAVARVVPRGGEDDLAALGRAAWEEVRGEKFSSFAVRAKRSDKSFPHRTIEIEVSVGQYLVDQLRAEGARRPRQAERSRADLPHRNSARAVAAGVCAENSRRGRTCRRTRPGA